MKNLSDIVASKKTAQSRLLTLVSPFCTGMHRDNSWKAVSQLFNSVRAMGGEVSIEKTEYFSSFGVNDMGKKWFLSVTSNGFSFPCILTASFSDKPNGEIYDLVLTV
jgi:hypothetical protein